MATIRVDKVTGKTYTYHNIPIDKKGTPTCIQCRKGFFKILNQNSRHPDDSWYEGRFIGDRYAVFMWINNGGESGFFQQVSPWYMKYGNAVRKMNELAKD